MTKKSVLGWGVLLVGTLVGCSDSAGNKASSSSSGAAGTAGTSTGKNDDGSKPGTAGEGGGSGIDEPGDGSLSVLMRRATSCDDLGLRFREQVLERLAEQVEANIVPSDGTGGSSSVGGMFNGSAGTGPTPGTGGTFIGGAGAASGGVPSASGGTGSSNGGAVSGGGTASSGVDGPEFTGTNTQVANVDEPDFVKTDGQNLYIVQNQQLRVATAYPATSLAELASISIQGVGLEMFLADAANADEKQLVVYSAVDGSALEQAPGSQWLKVTVLKLSGSSLEVSAEYFFEGSYLSARRTDARVRQVLNVYRSYPGLRTYPTEGDRRKAELLVLEELQDQGKKVSELSSAELDQLFYKAMVEVVNGENEAVLAKVSGEDLVPHAFVLKEGKLEPTDMACDQVYIPAADSLDQNVTYVSELSLNALSDVPTGSALLGSSSNVYQNEHSLVLASPPTYLRDQRTVVHAFDLGGDEPLTYVASGEVTGYVQNSFGLDEQEGDFHVVTSSWGNQGNVTKLFTLEADGTELAVVGETPDIAPGETLRSVRFVGPTAYVVTFRNTDPLFVIDLTDPTAPTELGSLEIPGFSQYMHPVAGDKLLTIGSSDAWSTKVMLRLFDVSDKAAPALSFSHEFSDFGSSAAQIDHRAFTYFGDRGLLAVPFSGYAWSEQSGYELINRLALIKVDLDAGFSELGAIEGKSLIEQLTESGSCQWSVDEDARIERGTFIEDTLYAIASHGVVAAKVDAPAETIATLALGVECPSNGGTGGVGGTGFGGTGGVFVDGGSSGSGTGGVGGALPSGTSGTESGGTGGAGG